MANTLDFTFNGKDKTQTAFKSLNRSVSKTQQSFDKLKGAMKWLSTAGGVAGVAGLTAFAKNMLEVGDRIGKVSSKLGISAEQLQKFQFSAEQSGVSTETLNMAFQRFTRRIADARAGTGTALKAFNQMGISLQGAGGQAKTAEELFFEVADSMKGMTSETDKVSLAFKFFDSEGVSLVNMLQNGSEAIENHAKQLEDYSGIINDEAIKASEDFNDALNLFSKGGRGIFANLILGARDFIQALEDIGLVTEKVFHKSGEMKKGMSVTDLVKEYNKLENELRGLDLDLATLTSGWDVLNLIFKSNEDIAKEVKDVQDKITEALWKQFKIEESLQYTSVKEVKNKKVNLDLVTKTSKLIVEDLVNTKLAKDQTEAGMRISETTLQLDEKLYQVTLKDLEGKGESLGVVKGLTKEQAEQLVGARQTARVQLAQNKSLAIAKELTADIVDLEKEKEETVYDTVGLQMTAQGFMLKILGSSKKVGKAWSGIWELFGKAFDGLTTGWLDSTDNAEAYKKRMLEINNLIKEINTNIDDSVDSINNITSEQQALAKIEKTYQKRKSDSERLNATQLLHYAEQERIVAILAYRVGVLRNATQAFASSVQQFLDAVATEGFTDLQKQFFSMVTGFTRSVLKDYTAVIASADAIIAKGDPTAIKGRVTELQTTAKSIATFGPITGANVSQFNELSETFWKNFESLEMDKTEAGKWFRKRMLELSTLGGEEGIKARNKAMLEFSTMLSTTLTTVQAQITTYNEAIKTKTATELLMGDATKGLTIMLKDTILKEYQAGKSIEHLKIDVNALSKEFLKAGVKIQDLLDYIDSLTASGASGGLFKKYPYGGNIFGPSHSGGGVNANLEGGEFVMSRSAVNRYGSDFMSSVNNGSFGGSDQVEVSVYLDMEGQVKMPLHSYISSVTNKAERSGNPELAGILAG